MQKTKINNITITPLSQFEKRLPLIEKFIAREGHAHIPLGHQEDGQPIGYWCSNWHFRIETAIETIPKEQLEALRQIGFLCDQQPQQRSSVTPEADATKAKLFPTQAETLQQPPAEEKIDILETWRKPKKEPQQQETWLLPVGCLRSIHSDKPALTVAVKKKRRWAQVPAH